MNFAAHQEKYKKENIGKREAGEERKQSTGFQEAGCCPSTVVQGQPFCDRSEGSTVKKWFV